MSRTFLIKANLFLAMVSGVLILAYTCTRAVSIPITHDEAGTFNMLIERNYHDVLTYSIPEDHMLNTLLIKTFTDRLGRKEWVVRLPNLLGHLMFIIFSLLIVWKYGKRELLFPAFLALNLNPYLLDFFSCARGYALSSAFILPSLYFLLDYLKNKNPLKLFLSLFMAMLGVLTLVTLLNFYIVVAGISFAFLILMFFLEPKSGRNYLKYIAGVFVIFLVSFLLYKFLNEAIVQLSNRPFVKQSYADNFYEGTIRTIVFRSIYTQDSGNLVTLISYSTIALYFLTLVYLVVKTFKTKLEILKDPLLILFLALTGMSLSVTFQYELFHIRYPFDRSAMFFIPAVMLLAVFFVTDLYHLKYGKPVSIILVCALAILMGYDFLKHANVEYYVDWDFDRSGREMMTDIEVRKDVVQGRKVELGTFWIYEPSANFYRLARKYDWMAYVTRDSLYTKKFDFYYLRPEDTVGMNFKPGDILKTYPATRTMLIRRQQ